MFTTNLNAGWDSMLSLSHDWDQVHQSCTQGVMGPDATCSFAWASALASSFLKDVTPEILSICSNDKCVAILPVYQKRTGRILRAREIRPITEAHGGRPGFLTANSDEKITIFALGQLLNSFDWDTAQLTLVEESKSQQALEVFAKSNQIWYRRGAQSMSPYVLLESTWDDHLATLPKKMRWNIRKSQRDLEAAGELVYRSFTDPSSIDEFVQAILEIEANSWKETEGSSITAHPEQREFYEALIAHAGELRILSGHVLFLDHKPIAYILGLLGGDGVFLDLKESFDSTFADFSPAHVLKRFAIETLTKWGINVYDFMGACEPYKMRWTSLTYTRVTYTLYNKTVRGALAYSRQRAVTGIRVLMDNFLNRLRGIGLSAERDPHSPQR